MIIISAITTLKQFHWYNNDRTAECHWKMMSIWRKELDYTAAALPFSAILFFSVTYFRERSEFRKRNHPCFIMSHWLWIECVSISDSRFTISLWHTACHPCSEVRATTQPEWGTCLRCGSSLPEALHQPHIWHVWGVKTDWKNIWWVPYRYYISIT